MEIPDARVMRENSYRIGGGQVHPYRYYYGTVSPHEGLEITGRITEIIGVPFDDQTTTKDKSLNLKYRFLSEGKYTPALAIGIMDPHGTRVYPSQYIVASKQIYPFDLTLGFGNGRFGKKPLPNSRNDIKVEIFTNTRSWLEDSQFFGGIQFSPSEKFALMAEYSPIKYHIHTRDPAQEEYFTEPVRTGFNVGVRYKPTKWSEIDLSYQRGDEIGFNISMMFDIGKPLIPIYDPPFREDPVSREGAVSDRIASALHYLGFSDISVTQYDNELRIEAQNERYFYSTEAIGAALNAITGIVPDDIERIHFVLRENGIPQVRFSAFRSDIINFYNGEFTVDEFYSLSDVNTGESQTRADEGLYRKKMRYGIKPSIETFLNDPSGFYKYRLGLSAWAGYHPWDGATVISALEGYPVNNISTSNEPLSIPVRSDIALYKEKKVSLGKLMFDQIYKTGHELYGKFSAGLLEVQYAGLDAEIARPFFDGIIMLGLSGSAVKKRDPDNPFQFKKDDVKGVYTTAFINARLSSPGHDISLDVKAGRFLAGDNGVRFTLSKFINGVILSAWYTITDTSVFTDYYNRGYNDKGISVSVPIRMFLGSESRSVYNYSLAPWTRDAGQDIYHFGTLFDFIGRNTKKHIDRDRNLLER